MQVLEGVVGTVGAGMWEDGGGGGGGRTTLSIFEIGEHHLRRIVLPDYLRSYIAPGQRTRIMVGRGWSLGVLTRPFIAAVEVNGRKAKIDRGAARAAMRTVASCLVAGGALALLSTTLALIACAAIAALVTRDYLELKSF